ncbi:hypothetical protein J6590_036216 [Homalodisca vitripennis]|nr:hypothetical protein J6590_036216 [Homalodisca vitripennis]
MYYNPSHNIAHKKSFVQTKSLRKQHFVAAHLVNTVLQFGTLTLSTPDKSILQGSPLILQRHADAGVRSVPMLCENCLPMRCGAQQRTPYITGHDKLPRIGHLSHQRLPHCAGPLQINFQGCGELTPDDSTLSVEIICNLSEYVMNVENKLQYVCKDAEDVNTVVKRRLTTRETFRVVEIVVRRQGLVEMLRKCNSAAPCSPYMQQCYSIHMQFPELNVRFSRSEAVGSS